MSSLGPRRGGGREGGDSEWGGGETRSKREMKKGKKEKTQSGEWACERDRETEKRDPKNTIHVLFLLYVFL
jgi:hypothetical protein